MLSPSTNLSTENGVEQPQVEARQETENVPIPPTREDSILKRLSFLDRFLALWILLAMVCGILMGYFVPGIEDVLNTAQLIGVSAPIAAGLILMMYPILCKVRFEELNIIFRQKSVWKQLLFSFIVNWIIAPLIMVGLAWAFLPDKQDYREGLILVGLARCIAMVLVWNELAGGDGEYCAILVAFNSVLQIILYAPFALFYINVVRPHDGDWDDARISYSVVAQSVAIFLGIPLAAAIVTRAILLNVLGSDRYKRNFITYIAPLSLIALLFTIIILFASQGRTVVNQIILVLRVSAPLIMYFAIIFLSTLWVCRRMGFEYEFASVQSFTAASNNFELAIAVAIATFGVNSNQALAATVGPLIEVPVLLGLVYLMRFLKGRWTWGTIVRTHVDVEVGNTEKGGE